MRLEITRKSDLAIRALQTLEASGVRMKGAALATALGTTSGFLAQVLTPLVQSGWVRSEPGPSGGYSLTGDLGSVSVLRVIETIEGPTTSARCVLADRPCGETGPCALHVPWSRAREQLVQELDAVKVADLPAGVTTEVLA